MLGIKRMDHVCMAVWKLDERLPMLTDVFGMKLVGRWQNPDAGYNGATLDIPGGGAQWEMLEPSDDKSFIAKFLNERGPGLHHVTFQCEDVAKATEALKAQGYDPFGGRQRGNYKEVFIHPKGTGGVLFQLFEGGWSD